MATTLSSHGFGPRRESIDSSRRIGQIAQALRSIAENESAQGTARLADLTPTQGELVTLLGDRNPYVRSGAAWWLRNLASEPSSLVSEALRAAIYDPNAHVVQSALGTVGILRLQAAQSDVLVSLEDSHPGVVHSAIFALGRIGPVEEGARLLPFLVGKELHLELAAITALQQLRYRPAIAPLIQRLASCRGMIRRQRFHFELPRRCMLALVSMKATEATNLLIEFARSEIGLRGMAVQALIDLEAPEAAPALLPMLMQLLPTAREEKLCCSLIGLMTAVDYRFSKPQIRAFLQHRLAGVRCAALRAVSRWNDSEAIDVVREMAHHDSSAFVRPVAVKTLGELAGLTSLPDLRLLISDANALVRAGVAEILVQLAEHSTECEELLAGLANDPAAPVARICREKLLAKPSEMKAGDGPDILPMELRDQAQAARAFLQRWQHHLPTGETQLSDAMNKLLHALAG